MGIKTMGAEQWEIKTMGAERYGDKDYESRTIWG